MLISRVFELKLPRWCSRPIKYQLISANQRVAFVNRFENPPKSHDGWYTITAINKAGRDQVRCRVTVDVEEASEVQDHGRKFKIQKTRKSSTQENGSPPLPRASGKVAKAFDAEVDERDMYDPTEQRKPTFRKKIENVKVRRNSTLSNQAFL